MVEVVLKESCIYYEDLIRVQGNIPNLKSLYNSSILVTGATGMIGSAIVDFLMKLNETDGAGISIGVASRSINKIEKRFPNYCEAKVIQLVCYDSEIGVQSEKSFDFVIHAASPANPKAYGSCPVETITSNVIGTSKLLNYCVNAGTKRFLYVSSSEVYGRKEQENPYREDDYGYVNLLSSRSCYPLSKRVAENLCVSYNEEYGIETVIVRPGHVYGPTFTDEDNRVTSQFVRDAAAGKKIILKSSGAQKRSHCYVADCVSAIITVLVCGENTTAYNISSKSSVSTIREYAETVCKITGNELSFTAPTDKEAKSFNPMDNAALDASSLEALGWVSSFDLQTGVKHTVDSITAQA